MDKVIIKNLLARGIIGVNDWERSRAQNILINLTFHRHTSRRGDRSHQRLRGLQQDVEESMAHAETAQRLTVEALANDLAKLCLEDANVQSHRPRGEAGRGSLRRVRWRGGRTKPR
ncbi:MAG: dihydroneopterin aldolase [Anaerolineales bacterium]